MKMLQIKPDIKVDGTYLIDQNINRPLECKCVDGPLEWEFGDQTIKARFEDDILQKFHAQRLNTALDPEGEFLRTMFKAAWGNLLDIRRNEQPHAKMLVFTKDKEHLIRAASTFQKVTGLKPIVVHEEIDHTSKIIEEFKTDSAPVIFNIRMLAEGVTIKPARVVCYATNVTEDLPFKQIVTRASRKENFRQKGAGSIWMPADQRLIECAKNVDGMNLSMVSKTDQKSQTINTGVGSYTINEYKFISSRLDKEFGIYSGETVSEEQLCLARQFRDEENANEIRDICDTQLGKILSDLNTQSVDNNYPENSYDEETERVRKLIKSKVNKIASREGKQHREIHREWIDNGGPRHDEAQLDDLLKKHEWLESRLSDNNDIF